MPLPQGRLRSPVCSAPRIRLLRMIVIMASIEQLSGNSSIVSVSFDSCYPSLLILKHLNQRKKVFFAHCHPHRLIIHHTSFLSDLWQDRVPSYLINAICAVAAPLSPNPALKTRLYQRNTSGGPGKGVNVNTGKGAGAGVNAPVRFAGSPFADAALCTLFGREIYCLWDGGGGASGTSGCSNNATGGRSNSISGSSVNSGSSPKSSVNAPNVTPSGNTYASSSSNSSPRSHAGSNSNTKTLNLLSLSLEVLSSKLIAPPTLQTAQALVLLEAYRIYAGNYIRGEHRMFGKLTSPLIDFTLLFTFLDCTFHF